MPKEVVIKKYQCGVCGKLYGSEEFARQCESTHHHAVSINRETFTEFAKFPHILHVTMDNGLTVAYKLWRDDND